MTAVLNFQHDHLNYCFVVIASREELALKAAIYGRGAVQTPGVKLLLTPFKMLAKPMLVPLAE